MPLIDRILIIYNAFSLQEISEYTGPMDDNEVKIEFKNDLVYALKNIDKIESYHVSKQASLWNTDQLAYYDIRFLENLKFSGRRKIRTNCPKLPRKKQTY